MFNGYCYDGHLREFTTSRSTNADGKNKNYYNVCPSDEVATAAAEQDLQQVVLLQTADQHDNPASL